MSAAAQNGSASELGAAELRELLGDEIAPRWLRELHRFLPVKSQFVLSGAIRDRVAFPVGGGQYDMRSVAETIVDTLALRGITHFAIADPVHGITIGVPFGAAAEHADQSVAWFNASFATSQQLHFSRDAAGRLRATATLSAAVEFAERAIERLDVHFAVIFDFLMGQGERVGKDGAPFVRALIASHNARPMRGLFSPLIWLVDRENDLPGWFATRNSRIRSISVAEPDRLIRSKVAASLLVSVPDFRSLDAAGVALAIDDFAVRTDGMALGDLEAIAALCRAESLPAGQIGEATRRYKLGITEDVWQRMGRATLERAEERIHERVRGQGPAIVKTLDIVRRAIVGLSGAQAARDSGRPRGVLFFAGPTGVGKTELAKALTEGLFGDERAYIRFDMSEFNHEHADQRLVGAPPGYVGYDAGGELTDAIRQRPCSIVLFDEIEKANNKILDKFLQILDDGQLTSGAGDRVWFSDALIIFTSNVGMNEVRADANYEDLETTVRRGVDEYFKQQLQRPELLNRIGDNIVVFDYIRPEIAMQIFEKMLAGILTRILEARAVTVELAADARDALERRCLASLANGGRGIGNMLESSFINPLSRALWEAEVPRGARVRVSSFELHDGVPTLRLEPTVVR